MSGEREFKPLYWESYLWENLRGLTGRSPNNSRGLTASLRYFGTYTHTLTDTGSNMAALPSQLPSFQISISVSITCEARGKGVPEDHSHSHALSLASHGPLTVPCVLNSYQRQEFLTPPTGRCRNFDCSDMLTLSESLLISYFPAF